MARPGKGPQVSLSPFLRHCPCPWLPSTFPKGFLALRCRPSPIPRPLPWPRPCRRPPRPGLLGGTPLPLPLQASTRYTPLPGLCRRHEGLGHLRFREGKSPPRVTQPASRGAGAWVRSGRLRTNPCCSAEDWPGFSTESPRSQEAPRQANRSSCPRYLGESCGCGFCSAWSRSPGISSLLWSGP